MAQRRFLLVLGAGCTGLLSGMSLIGAALPLALGFGAISAACLAGLAWDPARRALARPRSGRAFFAWTAVAYVAAMLVGSVLQTALSIASGELGLYNRADSAVSLGLLQAGLTIVWASPIAAALAALAWFLRRRRPLGRAALLIAAAMSAMLWVLFVLGREIAEGSVQVLSVIVIGYWIPWLLWGTLTPLADSGTLATSRDIRER